MALRELSSRFAPPLSRTARSAAVSRGLAGRPRHASTQAATADESWEDVDQPTSHGLPGPSEETIKEFDPVNRSRARRRPLPPSRYQFRPPKYYRGPLHPHQPPPPSDPSSREFIPGPFTLPRLQQTYESTIEPDLLTLTYTHQIPGTVAPPRTQRLRSWDDSSPYFANRPLRGPRGGDVLRLLKRPTTFRNVPELERITVHSFVKQATESSAALHVAGMVLQAITGARATSCKSKHNVSGWNLREGKFLSVKSEIRGEEMYHFLSRCVDIVMPRIKDYRGVKGSSGDSSGNISFGLTPDAVALFPEVEVNYDMYPAKMIPGAHVTIHTSATNDREARLLCRAVGIPFVGKYVD
ncbi:MAG: hypothetical protein M4579_006403 [Chaenotheca gracillima]|nr:MAG: hypothetical protein M4579_006403 [Chaenotheca gracillima]